MKFALLVLMILQGVLLGKEMEVRRYQVAPATVLSAHGQAVDDYVWNPAGSWWGEVVAKPGFESRFFGGGTWRDVSKRVAEVIGREGFDGMAYFDLEEGALVMKAEAFEHGIFASRVEEDVCYQIRAEVALYSIPGVIAGVRPMFQGELPAGAELRASLSLVHLAGQEASASTGDGACKVTSEAHLDHHNLDLMEVRLTFDFEWGGTPFSVKGGFTAVSGMPWFYELGSLDGEVSWVAQIRYEIVLIDGSLNDEWILREEGGAFLFAERLARLRTWPLVDGKGGVMRSYSLPPTFMDFISVTSGGGSDSDPFAAGADSEEREEISMYRGDDPELTVLGALYDCKELLRENGLSFREGDFAWFSKARGKLYAKLSETNFELLEGITMVCGPDSPAQIRVDFEEVSGDGKVLRKIGVWVLPGQEGTVALGPDLMVEVQAQIDASDREIEVRMALFEEQRNLEKPSFRTKVVLVEGVSVKVQESSEKGVRKEWRVTANIEAVGDGVEEYLFAKERGEKGDE